MTVKNQICDACGTSLVGSRGYVGGVGLGDWICENCWYSTCRAKDYQKRLKKAEANARYRAKKREQYEEAATEMAAAINKWKRHFNGNGNRRTF